MFRLSFSKVRLGLAVNSLYLIHLFTT